MTSDYVPHLCGRRLLPVHAARLHGRALCEAAAARRAAQEDCQSARGSPEGASGSRGPAHPCRRPPHEVLACLIMCLLACSTLIVTAGRVANAGVRPDPRMVGGGRRGLIGGRFLGGFRRVIGKNFLLTFSRPHSSSHFKPNKRDSMDGWVTYVIRKLRSPVWGAVAVGIRF